MFVTLVGVHHQLDVLRDPPPPGDGRGEKRLSLLIALSLRGMNDLHLGENVASYVTRGA